jgi:uncharacterized membrane protein YphA (DoxX/SURF4 family)
MQYKKAAFNIIRIILGLFFIVSGIAKLYPIEPFEIQAVDTGVSTWTIVPFTARILIAIEIVLGILLSVGLYLRFAFIGTSFLLILLTIYLFYIRFILGITEDCGCFGSFLEMGTVPSIFKNFFLIGITYFLYKNSSLLFEIKRFRILITVILILASLAAPFILNPVDIASTYHIADEKVGKSLETDLMDNTVFNGENVNLSEGKKLICFFSLSCPMCKFAAQKLAVLQKQNENQLPIYFVFWGIEEKSDEKLKEFQEKTNSENINYKFLDTKNFFALSGPHLPAIYFLQDGIIINKTAYRDMDPNEVDVFLK